MTSEPLTGWCLTLHQLLGRPLPPVPELPGQVHVCADRLGSEEEIADAVAAGDALALAGLLSCSTARAQAIVAAGDPGGALSLVGH